MVKKPRIIVREIPTKMKVREISEEPPEEKINEEQVEETTKEPSLESITDNAPSAREFPEFEGEQSNLQQEISFQTEQPEIPTPAGTTEAESRAAVRYQVQRDISERDIRRAYDTRSAETREVEIRNKMLLAPRGQITTTLLANPEVDAIRAQTTRQEEEYKISPEEKLKEKTRKYPWEM